MARRMDAGPRPGNVPTLAYEYVTVDEDPGNPEPHHHLSCKCGAWLRSPDAAAARWWGQSHLAGHLSHMVSDPDAALVG